MFMATDGFLLVSCFFSLAAVCLTPMVAMTEPLFLWEI